MRQELIYEDVRSSKFWRIEVNGKTHTVKFGRIGTSGQSKTKSFASPKAAAVDAEKLIAAKLKKRYRRRQENGGPKLKPTGKNTVSKESRTRISKKRAADMRANARAKPKPTTAAVMVSMPTYYNAWVKNEELDLAATEVAIRSFRPSKPVKTIRFDMRTLKDEEPDVVSLTKAITVLRGFEFEPTHIELADASCILVCWAAWLLFRVDTPTPAKKLKRQLDCLFSYLQRPRPPAIPIPNRKKKLECNETEWADHKISAASDFPERDARKKLGKSRGKPGSHNAPHSQAKRLFDAVWRGELGMIRSLLKSGLDPNALWNDSGMSPLMVAAEQTHGQSTISTLLQVGADVDLRDRWGQTALFYAVGMARADNCEVLLKNGAKPSLLPKRAARKMKKMGGASRAIRKAISDWP